MAGDHRHQAFEVLLREHRGLVLKVASLYARGADDRNDLVQEICVQLWRSFASYDPGRARFSTWLYRIALNVAISSLRRTHGAERLEPLQSHHLDTIGGELPPEPDDRLVMLYRVIGELDALNRALILLYLEDRSYAEMAEILGISETNVATKLGRIKQTLRSHMAGTPRARA
nr:sigma-70 family RNA polymerase sigma factor [Dyella sp. ASV24]